MSEQKLPLCVDLDGTLIRSDLLYETFVYVLFKKPIVALWCILILFSQGIAAFKSKLASYVDLDNLILPNNLELHQFLKTELEKNRPIILITAADQKLANKIAKKFGYFTAVFASDGKKNLNAKEKLKFLLANYGQKGFDYAANDSSDTLIWKESRYAYLVNASAGTIRKAKKLSHVLEIFDRRNHSIGPFLKAIRIHQLFKNILVFVPLLLGHFYTNLHSVGLVIGAFFSFCFATCSVYLLNDLVDLHTDRLHHRKQFRPLAAGNFSILTALIMIAIFLTLALVSAYLINFSFFLVLASYYCLTLIYSFRLKKIAIIDVFALAFLYSLRVVAGSAAAHIPLSPWLLSFSIFFFLGLAYMKRYSELYNISKSANKKLLDKAYHADQDLLSTLCLGVAANFISVLVLALYINSAAVILLYRYPSVLWLSVIAVLYFVNRLWFLTARGEMNEDPVVFLLKDRQSIVLFTLVLSVILASNNFF